MKKYHLAVLWLVIHLALTFLSSLNATMVLPMSLSEMTFSAEKIFRGVCTDIETELDEHQIPSTYIRFQVVEGLKGVDNGETILIKQAGSSKNPIHLQEGEKLILPMRNLSLSSKLYQEGKEYLLFYYPESEWGFTSPVGAGQGFFEVETTQQGTKNVVNPLNNRFLNEVGRENGREGVAPLKTVTTKVHSLILQNP